MYRFNQMDSGISINGGVPLKHLKHALRVIQSWECWTTHIDIRKHGLTNRLYSAMFAEQKLAS